MLSSSVNKKKPTKKSDPIADSGHVWGTSGKFPLNPPSALPLPIFSKNCKFQTISALFFTFMKFKQNHVSHCVPGKILMHFKKKFENRTIFTDFRVFSPFLDCARTDFFHLSRQISVSV